MGSTGWHLFGIAHVKVDFIPLQKMHVNLKLEALFLNYRFCTMCDPRVILDLCKFGAAYFFWEIQEPNIYADRGLGV